MVQGGFQEAFAGYVSHLLASCCCILCHIWCSNRKAIGCLHSANGSPRYSNAAQIFFCVVEVSSPNRTNWCESNTVGWAAIDQSLVVSFNFQLCNGPRTLFCMTHFSLRHIFAMLFQHISQSLQLQFQIPPLMLCIADALQICGFLRSPFNAIVHKNFCHHQFLASSHLLHFSRFSAVSVLCFPHFSNTVHNHAHSKAHTKKRTTQRDLLVRL